VPWPDHEGRQVENTVSNWGRWGEDDQLGQLNLITPRSIISAVRLVKKGRVYNLAVPLEKDGPQSPTFHKTRMVTYFSANTAPGSINYVDDYLAMETHSGTHIDALGHFFQDGLLWNGRSTDRLTSRGLGWAGIDRVGAIVGRGVMLDLPRAKGVEHLELGEVVTPADMEQCAAEQGVAIEAGDILLLRTGWYSVFDKNRPLYEQGEPGPDFSCGAWLKEKDIIALGADNFAVERFLVGEREPDRPWLHTVALRDLGIYLIENLDLEGLAYDRVHEFLFVAAPLKLPGASGAPFTPLGII
jgi:kynurenine formamidase